MKDFIFRVIVGWLADNLTSDKVDEWAKVWVVPKLHDMKNALVAMCRVEAAKTETTIDDAACNALEALLNAILPPLDASGG